MLKSKRSATLGMIMLKGEEGRSLMRRLIRQKVEKEGSVLLRLIRHKREKEGRISWIVISMKREKELLVLQLKLQKRQKELLESDLTMRGHPPALMVLLGLLFCCLAMRCLRNFVSSLAPPSNLLGIWLSQPRQQKSQLRQFRLVLKRNNKDSLKT